MTVLPRNLVVHRPAPAVRPAQADTNPWTPAVYVLGTLAAGDGIAAVWAEYTHHSAARNWLIVAGLLLITLACLALGNETRYGVLTCTNDTEGN